MTKARSDKRGGKKLGEILCASLIAVMGAGVYSACKSNIEGDDQAEGDDDEGGDADMDVTNPDAKSAGKGGSGGVQPDAGAGGATTSPKDAAPGPVGACGRNCGERQRCLGHFDGS